MPEESTNQEKDVAADLLRAVSGPLTSPGAEPAVGTRFTSGDQTKVAGYSIQTRPDGPGYN